MGDRRGAILAVTSLVIVGVVLLAATGPSPSTEVSGQIRRYGGACLQLEKWGLTGWKVIGQAHTVADLRDGTWHEQTDPPPCPHGIDHQIYMVRPPLDAPEGIYRIRGLDDDEPDLEFRRVEFVPGEPGP